MSYWVTTTLTPGQRNVFDPQLAHKRLLKVKRAGLGFDLRQWNPLDPIGSRQVYQYEFGGLHFANEGNPGGESVYVLIK